MDYFSFFLFQKSTFSLEKNEKKQKHLLREIFGSP